MALTREGRFVFDYDRVDAVLPELMDVSIDRFTVSKNSEDKIRTLLDLENLDTEEELRAVRNAVVRRLSDMQDRLGENNFDAVWHLQTQISGITAVIDNELWKRGYPV